MNPSKIWRAKKNIIIWATVGACFFSMFVANVAAALSSLPVPASAKPFKLDIRVVGQPPVTDGRVLVQISLQSAENEPTSSAREYDIEVEVTAPSGSKQKYAVSILAGQSTVQFSFYVHEAGLFQLRAQDTNHFLLSGGNSVLVGKKDIKAQREFQSLDFISARFLNAAYQGDGAPSHPVAATFRERPRLLFINSTGREILADGRDFARLQVYFIHPEGRGSSSDINIWLSSSIGEASSQPLVIRKGESVSEIRLTSRVAGEAHVSLVSWEPAYPVDGPQSIQVSFEPPIYGIRSSNSSPLVLSLVDYQPLLAQFFDDQGRTVQTNQPRRITFSSSSPILRVEPLFRDVNQNEAGASALIFPTWIGSSTLTIFVPGYEPQKLIVKVTIGPILILCLAGGIVGGLADKEALQASLVWMVWRSFVGVIGAAVSVWSCVYVGLPQTLCMVAHNRISALVISFIGGYSGTRSLYFVMRQLGLHVSSTLSTERRQL